MKSVYLAQLLCPTRHCVAALAGEFDTMEEAETELQPNLLAGFEELCKEGLFSRQCGLCESRELHIEVGKTGYRTMDEARGPLTESARRQAATAAYLHGGRN